MSVIKLNQIIATATILLLFLDGDLVRGRVRVFIFTLSTGFITWILNQC